MKYYLKVSRRLFNDPKYAELSMGAKWLYIVLIEMSQRYCKERTFFTRSDQQLAEDAQISLATLKRYKAELTKTDLIETWQTHYEYNHQKSENRITAYRISTL